MTSLCSEELHEQMLHDFRSRGKVLVAYSGGVDSGLLAYIAKQALGDEMLAVLADSPSLSRQEFNQALSFAKKNNIPLEVIRTEEMSNPSYLANQGDRCYYCKSSLFEKLTELQKKIQTKRKENWQIVYGVNLDDLGDYRPGLKAAEEFRVSSPYLDLKWSKQTIRSVASSLNLSISEKPAMPCLSSRIPHGQEVNLKKLQQVEKAEAVLLSLGFHTFRVRHHEDIARIEVAEKEIEKVLNARNEIDVKLKEIGFKFIAVDLEAFKSGSLNRVLV